VTVMTMMTVFVG